MGVGVEASESQSVQMLLQNVRHLTQMAAWQMDVASGEYIISDDLYTMHGVTREMGNKSLYQIYEESIIQCLKDHVAEAVRSGRGFDITLRTKPKDGVRQYFRSICEVIRDSAGRPVRLQGVLQDITKEERLRRKIKESEALLRSTQLAAPLGMFITNVGGNITYINDVAVSLTKGLRAGDVSGGKHWIEQLLPAEDRADILNQWRQTPDDTRDVMEVVARLETPQSHEPVFGHIRIAPVFSEAGTRIGYVGFIEDISEQRRMITSLQDSENRLKIIFESAPLGIFLVNKEGVVTYANPQTVKITGHDAGEPWINWASVEERIELHLSWKEFADNGSGVMLKDISYLHPVTRKTIYLHCRFTEPDNKALGQTIYVGYVEDNTPAQEARQKLIASEARLKAIYESAPIGLFITDVNANIIFTNNEAQRICNLGNGSIGNLHWTDLVGVADRQRALREWIYSIRQPKFDFSSQYWSEPAHGSPRRLAIKISRLIEEDRFLGYVGFMEDVTDTFESLRDLRRTQESLREAHFIAGLGSLELSLKDMSIRWSGDTYEAVGLKPYPDWRGFMQGLVEEDAIRLQQKIEKALSHPESFSMELRHRINGQGGLRYTYTKITPQLENGAPACIHMVMQDITERRETEIELEQKAQYIVQAKIFAKLATCVINVSDKTINWSDNTNEALDLPEYGQLADYLPLIHPDDRVELDGFISAPQDGNLTGPVQFRYYGRDGKLHHGRITGNPIFTGPELTHIYCTIQDVSRQVQREALLEDTARRMREAHHVARVGSFDIINDGNTPKVKWVEASYESLNLPPIYSLRQWLKAAHAQDVRAIITRMKQSWRSGKPFQLQTSIIDRVKDQRYVEFRAVPQQENGLTVRLLCTLADVTEVRKSEMALSESQQLLLEAQRLANIFTYEIDLLNDTISGNESFISQFKPISEENPDLKISIEEFLNVIWPQDREEVHEKLIDIPGLGKRTEFEFRITQRGGRAAYFLATAVPYIVNGSVDKIYGTWLDISSRKMQEMELRRSEQKLEEAQRMAGLMTWEMGLDNLLMQGSARLMQVFGVDKNQQPFVSYERLINCLVPDSRFGFKRDIVRTIRFGEPLETELHIINGIGQEYYLLINGKLNQEDGSAIRLYGACQDITSRKMDELVVLESQQKLEEAQRMANLSTWEYTIGEGIAFGSGNLKTRYGADKQPLIPFETWMSFVVEEQRARVQGIIEESIRLGKPFEFDMETLNPAGDHRFATVAGRPVMKNGKVVRMYGTSLDITPHKLSEIAVQEARIKAEEATEAKSQFLSTMSHELRTPLNAVIAMTHLLIDDEPKPSQLENLNTLKFSSQSLLSLINDILDFSKIESGKITFEKIDFNLGDVLRGILKSHYIKAEEKNTQLTLNINKDIPELVVGDPTRFIQIMNNLVSNAVKFTDDGTVSVNVGLRSITETSVSLDFMVSDTGIGIPKEQQANIFDHFTQANNDTTRKFGGTGLGLAITSRLLALQGSEIKVKSQPGVGSYFYFTLSFDRSRVKALPNINALGTHHPEEENLSGFNILVAEDNKINQMVVKKFLDRWKATYKIVDNGAQAVEAAGESLYDMILMDVQMPVMDGHEATIELRRRGNDIVVVALTAAATSEIRDSSRDSGMNDFITKPINPNELFSKIRKWGKRDKKD